MDSPSIDYILTRWSGVLAGLAKGPDGYGPHAVEVVCAALDKALTERDKWRTYCEGARESVAALTAERDQARRERDEARQQLAEERARVLSVIALNRNPECPDCGLHLDADDLIADIEAGRTVAAADTGDCRTCKFSIEDVDGSWCHHPDRQAAGAWKNGKPPTAAWSYVHLSDDGMTRLPTSPRCPGHTRKES